MNTYLVCTWIQALKTAIEVRGTVVESCSFRWAIADRIFFVAGGAYPIACE
jgi:hypothetical protein